MASFRFFAREAGAVIVAKDIGRFITRQGLQTWDVPIAADELELYVEEPGGGVFLLDAGVWCAAP